MGDKGKLPPLNFEALADALLPDAADLVAAWLPGGAQRGHEYVCGSLAGGKGASCSVNLTTGEWADFSGDEKGRDLVSLYAKIHGLSNVRACVELARAKGLESVAGVVKSADGSAPPVRAPRPAPPPKPAPEREEWKAIVPVPGYAPKVNFKHQHRTEADIVHVSEYWRDADLLGYVVRFRTSDGGKDDIARTWCESQTKGGSRWHWKQWEEPRPLYLPGRTLPEGRTVVLVEGEIKAAVLQALLDACAPGVYVVAGWPGGCKAWQKVAWNWLAGRTVILWPDTDSKREQPSVKERKALEAEWCERLGIADTAGLKDVPEYLAALQALKDAKPYLAYTDQPGMKAMRGIGAVLRDAHACTVQLLPIDQPGVKPDGWDCKDAMLYRCRVPMSMGDNPITSPDIWWLIGAPFAAPIVKVVADMAAQVGMHYVFRAPALLTLPASPAPRDIVQVTDLSQSRNARIDPQGKKIRGQTGVMRLEMLRARFSLIYLDEEEGWF